MKLRKGILFTGLLALSGAVAAQGYWEEEAEAERAAEEAEREAQEAGEEVRTGFEETAERVGEEAEEARTEARTMFNATGELDDGDTVDNTLITNPLGFLTGQGLNLEYSRALGEKFAAVGGAQYSRAGTVSGSVTNFGLRAGADYFLIGRNNEGLRIGPRLEAGFGDAATEDVDAFARIGVAGELGYNWIHETGVTAGAAAGLRTGAISGLDEDTDAGGYGRINIGYSW